jgi:acyl-lipid omega-6 desaturase (Delta-12 desaturase)
MSNALAAPLTRSRTGVEPPPTRAELHARIAPYARAVSLQGYKSFATDMAIYALGIAGVLYFESLAGKIAGGVLAGIGLVSLGSLAHEAAHRALVKSRRGNKVLAVILMTVTLFNYRLWIYDHHVLHHGRTNVKANNFLSPITSAEYRRMSRFRQALYRAYHTESGAGILLYFLLERWPTVHFYPGGWLPPRFRASAWGYTALLAAYAAALLSLLVLVPSGSVAAAVVCGFVLPYAIWFTVFSMTVFVQHTNPQLRWYRDVGSIAAPPEALSVHVGMPGWINHMTHYAMEHPVHHLSAMVPHYHLKQAQAALAGIAAPSIIAMRFTLGTLRDAAALQALRLRRARLARLQWRGDRGSARPGQGPGAPSRAIGGRPASRSGGAGFAGHLLSAQSRRIDHRADRLGRARTRLSALPQADHGRRLLPPVPATSSLAMRRSSARQISSHHW